MRLPRQRNDHEDTLYKIFNRLLGREGDIVLDPPAMRRLRLIVSQLCRLYIIKVTLLQVTGDGYGMLAAVPAAPPSRQTVEACFRARHGSAALMPDFDDSAILCRWTTRLRNVSEFVKDMQQRFTVWLNQVKHQGQRRGSSWCGRFKSIIVGSARRLFAALNGSVWKDVPRFARARQWQDPRANSAWRRFWDRHYVSSEVLETMGQLGDAMLASMLSGSASPLLSPLRPRRY
jgi:hypothetical protein